MLTSPFKARRDARARRRTSLPTPEGQALARQVLSDVVAYVRYCHTYDDIELTPREERTLADLEALAATPHSEELSTDPLYPRDLHVNLRTARKLMKGNDLWLAHHDTERRGILASLVALGFQVQDHSLSSDPDLSQVEL